MKILQVAILEESTGGPFNSSLNLHLALHQINSENALLAFIGSGDLDRIRRARNDFNILPIINRSRKIRPRRISPRFLKNFANEYSEFRVVHFHGFFMLSFLPMLVLCRFKKKTVAFQLHGSLMKYEFTNGVFLKSLYIHVFKFLTRNMRLIFVCSSQIEIDQIPKTFKSRFLKIFLLNYRESALKLPEDSENLNLHNAFNSKNTRVLFLGRITKKKNLKFLAEAVLATNLTGRNLELVVVGPVDHDQNQVLTDCMSLLSDKFLYLGPIFSKSMKAEIMSHCHIFALPSVGENFALSALEAEAHGLHILISENVGSIAVLNPVRTTVLKALDSVIWSEALNELSYIFESHGHYQIPERLNLLDWRHEALSYLNILEDEKDGSIRRPSII